MFDISPLQKLRSQYTPKIPVALNGAWRLCTADVPTPDAEAKAIAMMFPHTSGMPRVYLRNSETETSRQEKPLNVGILLSGGQAPGGHNVISGLFDGLKSLHPDSRLYGFLMGPDGLINHKYIELTEALIAPYRNAGGFDMIGSGRTKLEKKEQFDAALLILKHLDISALVIVGGDDSNTNAAILAEYYRSIKAGVQIIGCPKTIDGDLKGREIECSFGFDTATKLYAELIGNVQRDCVSAKKYWHFIKLMGRTASHITLECALKCQPNIAIISEDVKAKDWRIADLVEYIAEVIAKRAERGLMYGIALIPEGILEFLPSFRRLIDELNDYLSRPESDHIKRLARLERTAFVAEHLKPENASLLLSLPQYVALQLLEDRDPHGNVQVSKIETEVLLVELVKERLSQMAAAGRYQGKFAALTHFFGYEGRCSFPSNFDADYCYSLGRTAVALISEGLTGYMATVSNTTHPADHCVAGGVPFTRLMHLERRAGLAKPVIRKSLVDLQGAPFAYFAEHRSRWESEDCYVYPGPLAFYGPREICDEPTLTLRLEIDGTPFFE
ncbi:pyrophosphate-fructose 6-phosphate 1-phosphotransferase, beta subunit [Porphyromonas crevioricanis JCM 15906]|uniref:Pyrophosphate--fructose 6-phosphate 1-phosphotransferase n=1 Tax=Porphyromonas crevioricanis JCM 15906 TaxID=1305617 RepID=T1CH68_9PORP|nr:diphosphate--fructose-6-phosphate 1-phosphotransferase [Porphyromonas crevioricanis]GAD05181.1 pyrophosphate-fructose 6-phosphate 1-phosphotransferase, beta subunit [Porphyromonas crevioricanis JCM 15906]SKA00089.1 pyrophosphate--fructose-6-phosphate 1-phosphotransferase [Porphyromonas crevioricanis]